MRLRRRRAGEQVWQGDPGWWWCFDHARAENPPDSPGHRRLGPYPTEDEAVRWRDRLDTRNEEWEEEDRRWADDGWEDER